MRSGALKRPSDMQQFNYLRHANTMEVGLLNAAYRYPLDFGTDAGGMLINAEDEDELAAVVAAPQPMVIPHAIARLQLLCSSGCCSCD